MIEFRQFKTIHFKSKTNKEENFDATEELHDLTKKKDSTKSGNEKERAITIFHTGTKSIEKYMSGNEK